MSLAEIIVWVAAILMVGAAAYQVIVRPGTVGEKLTTLEQAARAAREIVAAAEQLYNTGNLTADERYDYVADLLGDLFPSLDSQAMRAAIEAAVHWRNIISGDSAHPKLQIVSGPANTTGDLFADAGARFKVDYGGQS